MPVKRTHNLVFIVSLVSLIFLACEKKVEPPAPVSTNVKNDAMVEQSIEPEKPKPIYVYQGDKFKDPFIPAGISSNYQPDAVFDAKRAQLKAIIFGPQSKSALLMVGGTISYFIKGESMFDVMGKTVQGFTPKVFETKVVLYGEGDTMFEYTIKKSEKGDN